MGTFQHQLWGAKMKHIGDRLAVPGVFAKDLQ